MTSVRILWLLLCVAWIVAEIGLARKTKVDVNQVSDSETRSQWILWLTVVISLIAALIFKALAWTPILIEYLPRQFIALVLFAVGLYFRYYAVGQLGHFFTTNVSIQREHKLIIDGPYRWVRHPAYSGLLIALAAAGLAMGDLVALLLLVVPVFFALRVRIDIEEMLLNKKFGIVYQDYCKSTRKLLPWLY